MGDIPGQTPNEELKHLALEHYESLAEQGGEWFNSVPKAIKFYYDNKEKIAEQQALLDECEEYIRADLAALTCMKDIQDAEELLAKLQNRNK